MKFTAITNIPEYDLKGAIRKSLSQSVEEVRGRAVKNAPYQTGNLRRSITTALSLNQDSGMIGTNLPYARLREYTNKKNPSRRYYMKRALEKSQNAIKKYFTKNINNVFINK